MKTLIVGAGIAGPALAHHLVRAGHEVTVAERAAVPREGGQAVDLRGAGRTVVERMGLMPAVRATALEQRGMSWVDDAGRARARIPSDAFGGEGFVSEIEILRGDLARLLYDATRGDVDYRFGERVQAIRQDEAGVEVDLRAGIEQFDLVVGADGFASTTRRLVFGDASVARLGCATAWFTVADPGDLDGWYQLYLPGGGRNASLRPGRVPGEAKAALALEVDPAAPLPADRAGQTALLRERFAGAAWHVPQLLAALDSPDFAFADLGQVRLDCWSRGRVALLGDAGACPSPLTGLGTTVALVQAYVLAGELGSQADLGSALARWESRCRAFVAAAQQLPPGGTQGFVPRSRTMIRLQELSMRSATRWPMRAVLEHQFAKAGAMDLPDYA